MAASRRLMRPCPGMAMALPSGPVVYTDRCPPGCPLRPRGSARDGDGQGGPLKGVAGVTTDGSKDSAESRRGTPAAVRFCQTDSSLGWRRPREVTKMEWPAAKRRRADGDDQPEQCVAE